MKMIFAQNLATELEIMYQQHFEPAVAILLIIALVAGVIYNLPKVLGDDRDAKGFFFGVGRFVLGAALLPILIALIRQLV